MLDILILPVSALLLAWHTATGTVLDPAGGTGWTVAVVLLVVTLRLLLVVPALRQLRATRRLRALGPQLAALRRRHSADREELARRTLELQRAHGVGPGATLLPVLVQLPVVAGLYLLLTRLAGSTDAVGALDRSEVASFAGAALWGSPLVGTGGVVLVGLLAAAGVALHVSARLALRRQPPEPGVATTLGRASVWVFPVLPLLGALVVPVPLAVAVCWVTTNLWTLGQSELLNRVLDRATG